jgi:hypothetical protein
MNQNGYFECSIDLGDKHLILGADCVGAVISFAYKKRDYQIHFPYFDFEKSDGFGHPLPTALGTKIGLTWLNTRSGIREYGSEHKRNKTNVLGFSASKFIVRSKKPVAASVARRMKQELPAWQSLFTDWLEVLEYSNLESSGMDVQQEKKVEAYFLVRNKKARRVKKRGENTASITINMRNDLSIRQIKKALSMASTNKVPPIYYSQLMSALRHHDNKLYRQSVLDTATATELAMTQLLEDQLSNHTVPQRRKLMKRYRQLSGLELGLTTLNVLVPSDISVNIGIPRNAAMHKGEVITSQQSQDALNTAKSYIYTKLPLKINGF